MNKKDRHLTDFIRLRIEGESFDAIAAKLSVSKQTLIEWNKQADIKERIEEGRVFKINELFHAYDMDRRQRLEGLLKLRKNLNDELLKRPLNNVPTHRLYEMLMNLTEQLKKEYCLRGYIGNNSNIFDLNSGSGFFQFGTDE